MTTLGTDGGRNKPPGHEGLRRKEAAHDVLAAYCEKQLLSAQRVFGLKLLEAEFANADDVRAVLKIAPGVSPMFLGAVPREFARAGIIERAGFTTTKRPEAHGRPVTTWRLVNRPALEKWLRDNPEPVKPVPTPPAPADVPTKQPGLPGIGPLAGGYF